MIDSSVILALMTGVPAYATLTIAVVVAVFVLFLYSRKINIEAITKIGDAQSSQIDNLQKLVQSLTRELQEARREINEISEQNKVLRLHIMRLEQHLILHNIAPPPSN